MSLWVPYKVIHFKFSLLQFATFNVIAWNWVCNTLEIVFEIEDRLNKERLKGSIF